MKYAIIPILKEIDVFGQAYEELYPEPPTNQVMHQRSAEIALYLIMKLYHANKPTEVSDE